MAIIKAICNGEKNPERLAELRHHNCKKSKEEIAKALPPNINEMLKGKFPKAKRDAMGDVPF